MSGIGSICLSLTLNPNSPGFSASKSYNAVQQGELRGICRWTDLIGEETGDAKKIKIIITVSVDSYNVFK